LGSFVFLSIFYANIGQRHKAAFAFRRPLRLLGADKGHWRLQTMRRADSIRQTDSIADQSSFYRAHQF